MVRKSTTKWTRKYIPTKTEYVKKLYKVFEGRKRQREYMKTVYRRVFNETVNGIKIKRDLMVDVDTPVKADKVAQAYQEWEQKKQSAIQSELRRHSLDVSEDEFLDVVNMTVAELCERFKATNVQRSIAKKTYERRHYDIKNYIIPRLGDMKVKDVKPSNIKRWFDTVENASKKESLIWTLQPLFLHAIWLDVITDDEHPITKSIRDRVKTDLARYRHEKDVNKTERIFNTEEMLGFYEDIMNEKYELVEIWMGQAGMREAEAVAIKWMDIDFDKNELHIKRQLISSPKTVTGGTRWDNGKALSEESLKTASNKNRPRIVPLPNRAREILLTIPVDERDVDKYVTLNKFMQPMCPKNFARRHHSKMMKKYKYDFKPHELRKWFGSYHISIGVPIATVSRWMGHKNPAVTHSTYEKEIEDITKMYSLETENLFNKTVAAK